MFDVMLSRKSQLPVLVLAFVCVAPRLFAVIVESRSYHGKKVQCVHGGAWVNQMQLGVYSEARLYDQVFTGTVQSAVEISLTDKRLQIIPDEIFLGDVAGDITATVNQACLPQDFPELKAGDKWLFFLQTRRQLHPDAKPPYISTDGLMVVSDSPSRPVSQAEYPICLLRLRSDLDESCIAAMTPRDTHQFCVGEGQPLPITSHVPQPFPFQRPPTTTFQLEGINLTHITAPPEFRAHDATTVNPAGGAWHPWPPSCSRNVH
jgi:hypothetical protein